MIEELSVLAIIPARGGSKGLPGKNIRPLAGKPLIVHTIEQAQRSRYIDRIVLSSDDPKIIEISREAGCDVPFVRPDELASDTATSMDVVFHCLKNVDNFDIVVLLQPTSPLRTAGHIDDCIESLLNEGVDTCISVAEVDKSPFWMFTTQEDGMLEPLFEQTFSRRQDLPRTYEINGAVYVSPTKILARNGSFISAKTRGYVMTREQSIDIDTADDFSRAELLVARAFPSESE